jgi:transcriptional regulator with XRE-family HTH domain
MLVDFRYRGLVIISDQQIGSHLVRLRGDMSQRELARRLRDRGLNWTHLTVASVERGERPLRVAEAIEVAHELREEPEMLFLEDQARSYIRTLSEARTALNLFYEGLDSVAATLEEMQPVAESAEDDVKHGVGGSQVGDLAVRMRWFIGEFNEIIDANERWFEGERG